MVITDWKNLVDRIKFRPYLIEDNNNYKWTYFVVVLNIYENPTIGIFKAITNYINNIRYIIKNTINSYGIFSVDIIPYNEIDKFHKKYFGSITDIWIKVPKKLHYCVDF